MAREPEAGGTPLPPMPLTFRIQPGAEVTLDGRRLVLLSPAGMGHFLAEDPKTGERFPVPTGDLRPWDGVAGHRRRIPDLDDISPERIAQGEARKAAVISLMGNRRRTQAEVAKAAAELGIAKSTLYGIIARYRREGSLTACIPHAYRLRKRKKRILPEVEEIIAAAIRELYDVEVGAQVAEVVWEVRRRCRRAKLPPPAWGTIQARIDAADPASHDRHRLGAEPAARKHRQVYGSGDVAPWPLYRYQVDHTVIDIFVVSPLDRRTVTRPVLTLVIDEFSRCVAGFYISIHRPSSLSVAIGLAQAILPKAELCRRLGVSSPWPVFGVPGIMLTDSALEFDNKGLRQGCSQYGIDGVFRPLRQPHFGGLIERLIGTMMGDLRLVPGYTFSNVVERGKDYDPEKAAALTMEEVERRVAIQVCDVYHREVHSALGTTPLKAFDFGLRGGESMPGRGTVPLNAPSDPRRLLIDFLPFEERTVQAYGLKVNSLTYNDPVLRAFHTPGEQCKDRHIVRFDPREAGFVYFYDKASCEYLEIPLSSRRSGLSLWEVDEVRREMRRLGQDPDDEDTIFHAVAEMRRIDSEARDHSKKARRREERRREDARARAGEAGTGIPVPTAARKPAPPLEEVPSAPAMARPKVLPPEDLEGW